MVLQHYPSANHGARWVKIHSGGSCSIIEGSLRRAITMQSKRSRIESSPGLINWITRCDRSTCVELPRISTPTAAQNNTSGTHDLQPPCKPSHTRVHSTWRDRNDRKKKPSSWPSSRLPNSPTAARPDPDDRIPDPRRALRRPAAPHMHDLDCSLAHDLDRRRHRLDDQDSTTKHGTTQTQRGALRHAFARGAPRLCTSNSMPARPALPIAMARYRLVRRRRRRQLPRWVYVDH